MVGNLKGTFLVVCLFFQLLCMLYLSSLRPPEGHSDLDLVLGLSLPLGNQK